MKLIATTILFSSLCRLLSRAFTITAGGPPGAAPTDSESKARAQIETLKQTLSTLPEAAVEDVGFEVAGGPALSAAERAAALERKLRDLKREEQLIREELISARQVRARCPAAGPWKSPCRWLSQRLCRADVAVIVFDV